MAKLVHPDPTCTSCSVGGVTFARAEDGTFEVPPGPAVGELAAHGFVEWVAPEPEPVVERPKKRR